MIYANQVSYFFYLKKQVLLQRKSNAPIFEAPRSMYMSIVVCINEILIADRVDANDVIISKLSIYCITSKLPVSQFLSGIPSECQKDWIQIRPD